MWQPWGSFLLISERMFHGSAPLGPIGYVLLQFSKSDVFVELKAPLKNESCQDRLWGMQWYGPQNDSNALGPGPTVRATFPEDGRVWPLPVPMPRKCLRMAVGPCWTHGQIRQVVSPFGCGLNLPGLDLQSNKSTGKIQKLKKRERERER